MLAGGEGSGPAPAAPFFAPCSRHPPPKWRAGTEEPHGTLHPERQGLPGAGGEPRLRASERGGARPAGVLRVPGRAGSVARATHSLRPPLPALPSALPRHRPDALVAAPGPRLAWPLAQRLAHTADCGRAPDPRARRGGAGGDQRLSLLASSGGARTPRPASRGGRGSGAAAREGRGIRRGPAGREDRARGPL